MKYDATVCILTYNGQEFLTSLLDSVYAQKSEKSYEILVIDSGSNDQTLEICNNYKNLRMIEIDNSEFGHGKTRNFAINSCDSEFILFLTQDAVPASDEWLDAMLEPFDISPQVSCVFGKQIPRPDCIVNVKREVDSVFKSFGDDGSISLQRKNSLVARLGIANNFFSDVNSALRIKNAKEIPYIDVNYAEDQTLGRDHLDAGWIKAYAPLGSVYHSHNYRPKKYFYRKFDEVVGLYEATGYLPPFSKKNAIKKVFVDTLLCWRYALSDKNYSFKRKLKNIVLAPIYSFLLQLTFFYARKTENHGKYIKKFSLESKVRKLKDE